jgi:hypothetical protein
MAEYRMSYTLNAAPPKPRADLGRFEGLTDTLLVVSVVGRPVRPDANEGASAVVVQLGPAGPEDYDPGTLLLAASVILGRISDENPATTAGLAARSAMEAIRKVLDSTTSDT